MPIGKLKALNVAREKRPGMYGDGGGLYLQVNGAGSKSWIFRFWVPERDPSTGEPFRDPATKKPRGTSREMGLGSFNVVSLEEARALAADARRLRHKDLDPIEVRRERKLAAALEKAKTLKFKDAAEAYITAHRAGWRNEKHAAQWTATLETYAYPVIGDLSVQAIDTALVMKVIEPIWSTKPETAARLRGRIESVLDWATVRQYRKGENPARWRGYLDKLLPKRSKVRKVKHYAALPFAELPAFLTTLRAQEGIAARALEFTILTAARTGETIGATWNEIDLNEKVWNVPGARIKGGKDHRVPISERAIAILDEIKPGREAGFVFPGQAQSVHGKRELASREGALTRPLSNMAMLALLERMERADLTVHGFRSTFRDWAAELTNFPSEVVEMALAHAVGDKVEAAYRRGDLFDKRRRLMDAWADFCAKTPLDGAVVPLRRRV
jgi:integrase